MLPVELVSRFEQSMNELTKYLTSPLINLNVNANLAGNSFAMPIKSLQTAPSGNHRFAFPPQILIHIKSVDHGSINQIKPSPLHFRHHSTMKMRCLKFNPLVLSLVPLFFFFFFVSSTLFHPSYGVSQDDLIHHSQKAKIPGTTLDLSFIKQMDFKHACTLIYLSSLFMAQIR